MVNLCGHYDEKINVTSLGHLVAGCGPEELYGEGLYFPCQNVLRKSLNEFLFCVCYFKDRLCQYVLSIQRICSASSRHALEHSSLSGKASNGFPYALGRPFLWKETTYLWDA